MHVAGSCARIAGSHGVVSIDVSEPSAPRVVGWRATTDARALTVSDGLTIVADGDAGLTLLDSLPCQAIMPAES